MPSQELRGFAHTLIVPLFFNMAQMVLSVVSYARSVERHRDPQVNMLESSYTIPLPPSHLATKSAHIYSLCRPS